MRVGTRLTANAIKAIPGRVLFQINRLVGMRLLTKAGMEGFASAPVPLTAAVSFRANSSPGSRAFPTNGANLLI